MSRILCWPDTCAGCSFLTTSPVVCAPGELQDKCYSVVCYSWRSFMCSCKV